MAGDRQAVQGKLLDRIQSLTPGSDRNRKLYEARFALMSDDEFAQFIDRLDRGLEILSIIAPNRTQDETSIENNFKIADEMGHQFFTKLWITGKDGLPDYLTPIEYMVLDLPVRRASQTSDKKISVPSNNKVVDALTGQVTGDSKGASLSAPEVQVLTAMGLEAPLIETMKYRGGDNQGRIALNGLITKYGRANLKTLSRYASGVESTATLKTFLTAAHLRNTL